MIRQLKKKGGEVVYQEVIREVEVPVIREVEVEKIIEVEKVVEVEKIVEVEKLVEVPVTREVEVEKIVEIVREVEVEKIVEVEKVVEVEKIVEIVREVEVDIVREIPVEVIREVHTERLPDAAKATARRSSVAVAVAVLAASLSAYTAGIPLRVSQGVCPALDSYSSLRVLAASRPLSVARTVSEGAVETVGGSPGAAEQPVPRAMANRGWALGQFGAYARSLY